jgi:hypothetical protein
MTTFGTRGQTGGDFRNAKSARDNFDGQLSFDREPPEERQFLRTRG